MWFELKNLTCCISKIDIDLANPGFDIWVALNDWQHRVIFRALSTIKLPAPLKENEDCVASFSEVFLQANHLTDYLFAFEAVKAFWALYIICPGNQMILEMHACTRNYSGFIVHFSDIGVHNVLFKINVSAYRNSFLWKQLDIQYCAKITYHLKKYIMLFPYL